MTANEITTLIAMNLDKELDVPFRLQLFERVKYWRSRLIANSLQKSPQQRKFFIQALFVKMTQVNNVPMAPLISTTIASTAEIPLPIRAGNVLFDYVGGPDGKSPFRYVPTGMANYLSQGRFTDRFPGYEYVMIGSKNVIRLDKDDQPLLRIDGIFDDPFAVMELSCSCTGTPCDTWNTEFPISGDIMQLIVQSILTIDYNRPDREDTPGIPVSTETEKQ